MKIENVQAKCARFLRPVLDINGKFCGLEVVERRPRLDLFARPVEMADPNITGTSLSDAARAKPIPQHDHK